MVMDEPVYPVALEVGNRHVKMEDAMNTYGFLPAGGEDLRKRNPLLGARGGGCHSTESGYAIPATAPARTKAGF
jgi:hypothetical protein